MVRIVGCLFLIGLCLSSQAQIRLTKLSLNKSEKYLIQASDILVVDTLLMADSAQIILNRDKKDNFIHAKIAIIGVGCSIIGSGAKGTDGSHGINGVDQESPCRQGGIGKDGTGGLNGHHGNNLFIYSDDIQIKGSITLNLNGGDGGDGGLGAGKEGRTTKQQDEGNEFEHSGRISMWETIRWRTADARRVPGFGVLVAVNDAT